MKKNEVDESVLKPVSFQIAQNYPNPFNPETNIRFTLSHRENVIVKIYNVLGHEVITLANRTFVPGSHLITWKGLDSHQQAVGSGLYICRIMAGKKVRTIKMALMR
jgi:flagellar hook assembly protein FlgD